MPQFDHRPIERRPKRLDLRVMPSCREPACTSCSEPLAYRAQVPSESAARATNCQDACVQDDLDSSQDRRRRELTRALQGEAATLLADLESYMSDLRGAVAACERILSPTLNRLDYETMQMVYEYAIMSYARFFSSGVRVKLGVDLEAVMSPDALAFHEHVLQVRNKLLAHAVSPLETVIPVCVLSDPDKTDMGVEEVGAIHFRAAWNLKRDVPNLLAIARGLSAILDEESRRLKEVILRELRRGDIQAIYDEPPITFSGKRSVDFAGRRRPAPGRHLSGRPWPLA